MGVVGGREEDGGFDAAAAAASGPVSARPRRARGPEPPANNKKLRQTYTKSRVKTV